MASYSILDSVPKGVDHLAAATLQGLVNRRGPRLYLLADKEADEHWVQWYREYGLIGENITWQEALKRFGGEARGAYVIGRQEKEIEIPLASTLAGLHDKILVTAEQAETVRQCGLAVEPLPIPTFSSRLEATRWAMKELRPKTDPTLLHCNPGGQFGWTGIVDLIVARKGFSFGLTTNPVSRPGERELLGELYRGCPPYAWLVGWFGSDEEECTYVDYASRHGVIPFCTGNHNLSFHRYVKAKGSFKQNPPADLPKLEKAKAYVTIVFSDGDAPHSLVDRQKRQWKLPQRGRFPFGWAIPPLAVEFAPAMLEYFYKTLTPNDELLCGPSGIGYTYLSHWAELRKDPGECPRADYLKRSAEFFARLDLRAGWPINRIVEWLPDGRVLRRVMGPRTWMIHGLERDISEANARLYGFDFMDDAVIAEYCNLIPESAGFFQGWHNIPREKERIVSGRAYFPGKVLGEKPEQTVADIEKIARCEGLPCFIPVHINCYSMGLEGVEQTVALLDKSRFEVVLPTTLLRLAVAAAAK